MSWYGPARSAKIPIIAIIRGGFLGFPVVKSEVYGRKPDFSRRGICGPHPQKGGPNHADSPKGEGGGGRELRLIFFAV